MGRKNKEFDKIEATFKLILAVVLLAALGIGGVGGFAQTFSQIVGMLVMVIMVGVAVLILGGLVWLILKFTRKQSVPFKNFASVATETAAAPLTRWTAATIRQSLEEIDWFQFEKFCAALLEADGFKVTRQGGAHPDGGVDLLVEKDNGSALIQCKHWRTWNIQEKVVREMLGSMAHFRVQQGAIYTLKGWTRPAAAFAAEHEITLVNGDELSQSAFIQFTQSELDYLLDSTVHHCPKCEAPMVLREGKFGSFWGCSTYPKCRGTLKQRDAA